MSRALDMFIVEGIHTSIPLHREIMKHPDFIAGRLDTKFMERFFADREARRAAEAK
jgi:acetyl-CoA carboxylase biotin carboxylase subunit